MVRKLSLMVAGLLGVVFFLNASTAEDKKTPSIKDVMKKSAGKTGLCAKCAAATKAEKWDDAQASAKELAELGEALAKNPCPGGDADSWKKLSKKYAEQTAAIKEAADKKDGKALSTAIGAFTKSCKECHDAHKGK